MKVVERKWNGEAGNFLTASQRLYTVNGNREAREGPLLQKKVPIIL